MPTNRCVLGGKSVIKCKELDTFKSPLGTKDGKIIGVFSRVTTENIDICLGDHAPGDILWFLYVDHIVKTCHGDSADT